MIKRTLFFSNAVCLTLKNKQLLIVNKETQEESSIPIEDIGFVVIENIQTYISVPLINALTENNTAVIFCNEKHLPFTMTLPLACNVIQGQLFNIQINVKEPVKKNCWKQIIECKINNQARHLKKRNINAEHIFEIAKKVKSGDSENKEGYAAKLYWDSLMGKEWLRLRFGEYPNDLLNYGYTVLRAATARALVGSGLLPTFGIHHHNKYDSFALADDLMEPYRAYIDDEIIDYVINNPEEELLTTEFKKRILTVLTRDVKIGNVVRPLMNALSITTSSLAKCLSGEIKSLALPVFS